MNIGYCLTVPLRSLAASDYCLFCKAPTKIVSLRFQFSISFSRIRGLDTPQQADGYRSVQYCTVCNIIDQEMFATAPTFNS